MDPAVIKNVILAVFIFVQVAAAALVIIIRYHFRLFALPGDRRARMIVNLMSLGAAAFFLVALWFFYVLP